MAVDNNYDGWDKWIGIGLVVGLVVIIAYAIKQHSSTTTNTAQQIQTQQKQDSIQGWKLTPIPRVDDLIHHPISHLQISAAPVVTQPAPLAIRYEPIIPYDTISTPSEVQPTQSAQELAILRQKLASMERQIQQLANSYSQYQPTEQTPLGQFAEYDNEEITEYIKDAEGDVVKKVKTRKAKINDKRK